jgi:cytochrome P450
MHMPFTAIARDFPGGMYYFDLWPFSSPLIVVSSNEGAQQIQDAESELRKPEDITAAIDTTSGGASLITMHGSQWKKWRGLFSLAFAPGHILDMSPAMVEEMDLFCELLRKRADAGEMFQLEDLTLPLTLDIIGKLTL